MAGKNNKWKNPFYALLIPFGVVFCVTSFAYGLMAFQQVNAVPSTVSHHADHPLYAWLRSHGSMAVLVELAILAVLTVGAIATDSWWTGRGTSSASDSDEFPTTGKR